VTAMAKVRTQPPHFEAALAELTQIVDRLEKGDQTLSLEDALTQFEKGIQLAQLCQKSLDDAEQKVKILTKPDAHSDLADFATESSAAQTDSE
jgi:exodeoxyribonuclease VII small subunit